MGMFIRDEVVANKELSLIDPRNDSLYKDISEVNLDGRCTTLLIKEPLGDQDKRFRLDCRKFLVELCLQMQKRFTFHGDSVLSLLRIIDPKESLSPKRNSNDILKLALHFPTLVKEEELDVLQDQWGGLAICKRSTEKS